MEILGRGERTERLKKALEFTEEDLAENRAGRLTSRQQDTLKQIVAEICRRRSRPNRRPSLRVIVRYGVSAIFGIVVVVLLALVVFKISLRDLLLCFAIPAVLGVILWGQTAFSGWRWKRSIQQINNGTAPVKRYAGQVKVWMLTKEGCLVEIGGRKFYPSDPVGDSFIDGENYTVYGVEIGSASIMVSGEAID